MEPSLKKWHATFREKCIRTGSEDPSYDQKWWRYQPAHRLNVDQSPFPFGVHGKETYEYMPKGKGSRIIRGFHNQTRDWRNASVPCRLGSGQKGSNQS